MSRIIKSQYARRTDTGNKTIKIRNLEFLFQETNPGEGPVFQSTDAQLLIEKASIDAEAMVREATRKAEQIVGHAEESRRHFEEVEKPQMVQEAREQGFNEGLETGRKKGYEEWAETLEYAKQIVSASKNDYQSHIEESERTILELGIKVAERIIGNKMQDSGEVYLSLVKQAIKEARDYLDVEIHVHPDHYEYILSQKEELMSIFPKDAGLYIYPDQELPAKGCIIESAHGRIDASVDSQLDEIKQKLVEMLEGE
ncbi:flagellar assembly protein FliH [Peribacillus glennii]|uniref:flagellar assembly protein FliH n=1 Tax=Peribacillus glennii TaxID=2303991 RepID=UPI0013141780|nr:flagellar assembly protein FliH [Peribacillus glennii]